MEQVKALLPAILWGSDEMDDGSILEAISAVQNLLQSLDGSELTSVARKLIPLLDAVSQGLLTCPSPARQCCDSGVVVVAYLT